MVYKSKRNIGNLDLYLSVNANVSKLPWLFPQVQYFVKRASEYLYYRLEATVANNVHIPNVLIKVMPLKRSFNYLDPESHAYNESTGEHVQFICTYRYGQAEKK